MSRKRKSEPSLVARLMDKECRRIDDALLDVRIATNDFVRHCVEILGKKGDVTFKPVDLWASSDTVVAARTTDKGDVLVYSASGAYPQHLEDLPLDDAVQIARILNRMVVDKEEKL